MGLISGGAARVPGPRVPGHHLTQPFKPGRALALDVSLAAPHRVRCLCDAEPFDIPQRKICRRPGERPPDPSAARCRQQGPL